MMHKYKEINMKLPENQEMLAKVFPLLTTTAQTTTELKKKANIGERGPTTRLNAILNHYCYEKKVIVKDLIGIDATWRLLLPGEIWHGIESNRGRRSKQNTRKTGQTTLPVGSKNRHLIDSITVHLTIEDYKKFSIRAKELGITKQERARQLISEDIKGIVIDPREAYIQNLISNGLTREQAEMVCKVPRPAEVSQ